MSFTPLNAFGGKLIIADAYKWKKAEILDFLKKVHDNPKTYNVPDKNQTTIKDLCTKIDGLKSPDGTLYKAHNPPLQLLRTENTLQPLEVKWDGTQKSAKLFSIFDLLGAFIALAGPAPNGATAKNYFLPLAAVYGQWCRALAINPGYAPVQVQITWVTANDQKKYAFLGSSVKGLLVDLAGKSESEKVQLKEKQDVWWGRVWTARRASLVDVLSDPYRTSGAPDLRTDRDGMDVGEDFGAGPETFPFLYILADAQLKCSENGLTLDASKVAGLKNYEGQSLWKSDSKTKKVYIVEPSLNSRVLMRWYGLPDYTPWLGDVVA